MLERIGVFSEQFLAVQNVAAGKSFGDRKPSFGARKTFGDRKPFGDKKPFGKPDRA